MPASRLPLKAADDFAGRYGNILGTDTDTPKPQKETLAGASVSPLHEGEPDHSGDNDISQILTGAKAVTGKAVWSANGAAAMQRENAEQRHRVEEKQEAERNEARELAHLAAWNAQMTNLGGIEMTNEEAQAARQHICDHADEYAERAVREGRIREDEKEDYKRTARRIRELKEREGRGIVTDAEKEECERLQRSRPGREAEHDAGKFHAERAMAQKMDAKASADNANTELRTGISAAPATGLFKSAPDINGHFSEAVATAKPAQDTPVPDAAIRNIKQVSFAPV